MFKIGQYIVRPHHGDKNVIIIWKIISVYPLKGEAIVSTKPNAWFEKINIGDILELSFPYDTNTTDYTITDNVDKILAKLL